MRTGGTGVRELAPDQRRLLLILGAISIVEGYDLNILPIALPQLRHSFNMSQAEGSWWLAVIYLGAIPAFLLARQADRVGRRRLLLVAMMGYTAATLATAVAPGIDTFAGAQLVGRLFLTVQITLTWTIAAEEMPAGVRGFGFGCLAAGNALGTGVVALLWGAVVAPAGVSWRWLYGGAVLLVVVIVWVWRWLPETTRFRQTLAAEGSAGAWQSIARPPLRRRLIALIASGVFINVTVVAAVFTVDFMETERHLSATAANLILIAAGAMALPMLLAAGRLSDRFGRKPVACLFLVTASIGPVLFFSVAHGAWQLLAALTIGYAGAFGAWPTANSFGTELFPTRLRALGGAVGNVSRMIGQSAGFALGAAFISVTSTLPRAMDLLCLGPLVGALVIAGYFPETSGRELEAISDGLGQTAVPSATTAAMHAVRTDHPFGPR